MSLPAPLSHAFPHLVAEIDADRPLISAALVDVQVTEIRDTAIVVQVTEQHSYDILTRPSQASYLDHALSAHFGRPGCTFILIPPAPPADLLTFPETTGNAPPATTNGSPQRNALKIMDRVALIAWMRLPENTEFVAKETDAAAAIKATTDLKIDITASNIIGIRTNLGIKKFKPEKPAADAPLQDVDLAALQKQFEAVKIDAATTREAYNQLIAHVRYLQLVLLQNATRLTAVPETGMAEFKDLKPLSPLPVTATAA